MSYSNAFFHHFSHSSSTTTFIHRKNILCNQSSHSRSTTASTSPSSIQRRSANLITFDLDDTIFPVGPVVQDANKALITHLTDECGYETITQESLIASTKKIRTELKNNENKVITYTELRQRAICEEINQYHERQQSSSSSSSSSNRNNNLLSHTDDIVVKAYDIWETNRHIAAERHLYHDTIQMLQSLKERYPDAIIGAITNGKGNPLKMTNTIHNYFDFCVSGEDDDVFPNRKPNEGIYLKSLERFYDLIGNGNDDENDDDNKQTNDRSKNVKSINWFHIGDDLANDVGASSKCGALAIWVDLNQETYNQSASKRFVADNKKDDSKNQNDDGQQSSTTTTTAISSSSSSKEVTQKQQQQPFWSTATKDEIEKRKQLNQESMQYVSARIETLSCLPETIEALLTQNVQK